MSSEAIALVYFGVAVALSLMGCFVAGRAHDDDPWALVIIAFLWPAVIMAAAAIGPFWLAWKAGKALS